MAEPTYRHVKTRVEQDVLVLTLLDKQILDEQACGVLRQELIDAVTRSGLKKVVVDFRFVEYVASVAFRPLLSLRRKVGDLGGRMVLCNLSEFVEDVFRVTRLLVSEHATTAPFEHQSSLTAAVRALS